MWNLNKVLIVDRIYVTFILPLLILSDNYSVDVILYTVVNYKPGCFMKIIFDNEMTFLS